MTFPLEHGLNKASLPAILVNIFDYNICLLLDTGSNQNAIDRRVYEHFIDRFTNQQKKQQNLETFYGTEAKAKANILFTLDNQEYEDFFIPTDIFPEIFDKVCNETGLRIHGILGNNFFLKYEWIIDFKNKEVYNN